MANDLGERLDALARLETPAVARFDSREAPQGCWVALPSAFNPPTRAHLRLLDLARGAVGAEGGAALLTTRNVAKGVEGAALAARVAMLLAARESRPGLAVLAANQARIVDQAEALRAAWPRADFDFALGFDTLVRLFEARYYEGAMEAELDGFFERHRVIAATRGELTEAELAGWIAERATRYRERIATIALDEEHRTMASSEARARIAAGRDSGDLLPPEVAAYIRRHGLYEGG